MKQSRARILTRGQQSFSGSTGLLKSQPAAGIERVPQNAEDSDQAALAAPLFRFRHQANRPIPPSPEAKSGKAAGSGAADGGSVTRAVNKAVCVPPGLGPSVTPFTATCHKVLPSRIENVVPQQWSGYPIANIEAKRNCYLGSASANGHRFRNRISVGISLWDSRVYAGGK